MKNPFRFGKEVSGYQFYDRRSDAATLRRKMLDGSANVVLFAPRRYGKTSLVLKVLKELSVKDGLRSVVFDMTKVQTLERFCRDYANAVYAAVGGGEAIARRVLDCLAHLNPEIVLSVGGAMSIKLNLDGGLTTESVAEVLDLPERLAEARGMPLVVAFDEFQEVAELSREFALEKIFRSCIQAHQRVRYVFLGSKAHLMKRMFGEPSRPFYQSAFPMPLGKPPREESLEFLVSRFADAGQTLGAAEAELIVDASANIPYYLQEVASETFENLPQDGGRPVARDDVEQAVAGIVARNSELYEVRLAGFSSARKALVSALSFGPIAVFDEACRRKFSLPVTSTLHTALKELVEDGVVESSPAGYCLGDPFLGRYLQTSPFRLF